MHAAGPRDRGVPYLGHLLQGCAVPLPSNVLFCAAMQHPKQACCLSCLYCHPQHRSDSLKVGIDLRSKAPSGVTLCRAVSRRLPRAMPGPHPARLLAVRAPDRPVRTFHAAARRCMNLISCRRTDVYACHIQQSIVRQHAGLSIKRWLAPAGRRTWWSWVPTSGTSAPCT